MNILNVEKLSKIYKEKRAVNEVSFSLEAGKCTALLGPNGAGKTTTLNMIAGLIKPTGGTIRSSSTPISDLRQLIGYLPQYPSFYDWMSGEEYLFFVGQLTGIEKTLLQQKIDELMNIVGLQDGRNRRISQYSGGMRQRLGIAQGLIHQPKIVILDEPVSALDPFGRREVIELMKRLKKDTTILFSTHILNDAEEISDNVLFMNNGKLIEGGSLAEVKNRHTNNVIRLKFTELAGTFLETLESENWVESIEKKERELLVYTENQAQGRQRLLKIASDNNWPLVNFELSNLSLEEVFTKVVQG